jgi:hypothetical protein
MAYLQHFQQFNHQKSKIIISNFIERKVAAEKIASWTSPYLLPFHTQKQPSKVVGTVMLFFLKKLKFHLNIYILILLLPSIY